MLSIFQRVSVSNENNQLHISAGIRIGIIVSPKNCCIALMRPEVGMAISRRFMWANAFYGTRMAVSFIYRAKLLFRGQKPMRIEGERVQGTENETAIGKICNVLLHRKCIIRYKFAYECWEISIVCSIQARRSKCAASSVYYPYLSMRSIVLSVPHRTYVFVKWNVKRLATEYRDVWCSIHFISSLRILWMAMYQVYGARPNSQQIVRQCSV